MDSEEGSPSRLPKHAIQNGHHVMVRCRNGEHKFVNVEKNSTVSLGKFGSFDSNELIGQPYGLSYEVSDKSLKVLPPTLIQELDETGATNELIVDSSYVQALKTADIEALKQSGIHASEIIQLQIDQHTNFDKKTEYSKDKYRKRKEAKYSKIFTTIEPTLHNVCDFWFNKDHNRIRDLRCDTLSQMLSMAGVRPGGRYLAVEEASGLVVSAILDRLGGEGRLITICDIESPPAYPIVTYMNFEDADVGLVLSSLNWATADEGHTPILPPSDLTTGSFQSERQKERYVKRKTLADNLHKVRAELFAGGFDGLVVASEYDPYSIIERLSRYLSGSAPIVVHSPNIQPLIELQSKLRSLPQYLGPAVTESWLRRYQVLPGRTHPMMTTSGSGGYLLHAIKVFDNPSAASVVCSRSRSIKREISEGSEI